MSTVYDGLIQGLNEALEYSQGKLQCRKNTVSVPGVTALHKYAPEDIKKIRTDLNMTQPLFADFMGVSSKTVKAWESGRNVPGGSARRLLSILQTEPGLAEKYRINTQ